MSDDARERAVIRAWQMAVVIVVLGVWEIGTRVPWLAQHSVLDPFFVSRPSLIVARLGTWMTARGQNSLWPHLAATLWATNGLPARGP